MLACRSDGAVYVKKLPIPCTPTAPDGQQACGDARGEGADDRRRPSWAAYDSSTGELPHVYNCAQ
jgi:hypothetical protein